MQTQVHLAKGIQAGLIHRDREHMQLRQVKLDRQSRRRARAHRSHISR